MSPFPAACLPKGEGSCGKQGCCTAADAADARRVADMLDIPFYAVNFEQEFARIVDYFVAEYTAGRTPNPCIVCNTWLKFGRLFDYADSIGAEYVATGHYARLFGCPTAEPRCAAASTNRRINPTCCSASSGGCSPRLMFPVGEYRKEEIRRIAERLGLRVAAKRDSQEICFVPDQDHARFVRAASRPARHLGRDRHDRRHGGRPPRRLRAVHRRPAQGPAAGVRPAALRGADRGGVASRGDRHAGGTCPERAYAAEANWLVRGGGGGGRGEAAVGRGQGINPKSEIRNPKCPIPFRPPPSRLRLPCEVKIRYRSPAAAATVEPLAGGPVPRPFRRAVLWRRAGPGRRVLRWRPRLGRRMDSVAIWPNS